MANVNQQFIQCSREEDISEMEKLLLQGADINYMEHEETALMIAVRLNYKHIVEFLVNKGVDVNLHHHSRNSSLKQAMVSRNIDVIKLLLKNGAQPDKTGVTLLEYASKDSYWSKTEKNIIKLLLRHGALVNFQDTTGKSALMLACKHQKAQGVKVLLKHKAQVDIKDQDGISALMIATVHRRNDLVKLLLKHGANVNLQDVAGNSALMHAVAQSADTELIKLLLDRGAQVNMQNSEGRSALTLAKGKMSVKLLLDQGAQVDLQDQDGNSALMSTCRNNMYEIALTLLTSGAHVNLTNKKGRSSLMFASAGGASKSITLLLLNGAEVNLQDDEGRSSLMLAIIAGYWEIAEMLLRSGPGVIWDANVNFRDTEGKSALMLACQNESSQDLSSLLARDTEVNLQDKEGWSALMMATAVRSESTMKVEQLVANRSTALNLSNNEGLTALMIASQNGYTEAVEILLQNGAKVDSRDDRGRCALMHASEHGWDDVATARLLLEHGHELNLQDNEGCTPLMVACRNGHEKLASFLLDSDADMYIKNNNGRTAHDIALEYNCTDILELFTKLRTTPSFPGILFSEGVKKESLTASAKYINLEDVGISLSIPEDALPSTDPPLEIQIQLCFSGSWVVPENLELVSPAYIVKPSRKAVFRKEVLVKIWHHANLETEEDCEDMVFLSASSTPEYRGDSPVYVFEEITGVKGSFRPLEKQPAGKIALKHFCLLGIFRRKRKGKGHLYSARLYTAREKKAVIFCMCLFQPQHITNCDRVIASHEEGREPVTKDGVTVAAEEVCVKQSCPREWKTFCKTEPASILKKALGIQTKYKPGDCDLLSYLPMIKISITNVPGSQDSEPLEISVEGLNVKSVFRFSPGEFLNFVVDTTKIKAAMEELGLEINKGQSLENIESSKIMSIATQMLKLMECIEKLLQSQDRLSVSNSVLHMLQEMNGKSRLLKDEANKTLKSLRVTYDIGLHVEAVSSFSLQLKIIYSANINHSLGSGNTTEWNAATSMFITNASNLMRSIVDVLKALKSAQALPNNCLLSDISQATPQSHSTLATLRPHPNDSLHSQATPHEHVCREYFDCEAPTMDDRATGPSSTGCGYQQPSFDSKPCMEHLAQFGITSKVSSQWRRLGIKFGQSLSDLDNYESKELRDNYGCCERVFESWINNGGHPPTYPLSWQGVYDALCEIGHHGTANDMKLKLSRH